MPADNLGDAANDIGGASDNFDRLRGILDQDDPRFERLHRKNIQFMERSVATLSNKMGLAID